MVRDIPYGRIIEKRLQIWSFVRELTVVSYGGVRESDASVSDRVDDNYHKDHHKSSAYTDQHP